MRLRADFDQRASVRGAEESWVPSPMPGVTRKRLDRIGDEVARATSLVRYAPGSAFSAHTHGLGEEFLVLEGVFQDEHGDHPAGSYVRNPPGSSHTPGAEPGCVILVKLRQFDPDDRTTVRLRASDRVFEPVADGLSAALLHEDARERVVIERWAAERAGTLAGEGGLELLVVDGELVVDGQRFGAWDWLRLPIGDAAEAVAGADGAELWVKRGHLRFVG